MWAVVGLEALVREIGRDTQVVSREALRFLALFRKDIIVMHENVASAGDFLARAAMQAIRATAPAPSNTLPEIARWAAGLGYKGVQVPANAASVFDLERAAQSQDYCDTVNGICAEAGVAITELSLHIHGQLVAVNPAYDIAFDAFAPPALRANPRARQSLASALCAMSK